MAKFIYSAFCDESGESTVGGQITACKANGITHMELRGFGTDPNINQITPEKALEIKKVIDAEGMSVGSIGSGYGKINIKDDFEPHFEAFKNTVEVAKILGSKYIRTFSFFFDKDDSFDEYKDEVIRRVKIMAEYAQENGIISCHENEKGIYGDIPERCLEVLEACDGKLRAVYDPANFIQCGVDTLKAYDMLKDYIEYFHVKDGIYSTGGIVAPGEGEGKLPEIFKKINADFDGEVMVSCEPHLKVFAGLSELEQDDETIKEMKDSYSSYEESFRVATSAMIKLAEDAQSVC